MGAERLRLYHRTRKVMLEGKTTLSFCYLKHPNLRVLFLGDFMNYTLLILGLFGICLAYGIICAILTKKSSIPKFVHIIGLSAIVAYTVMLLFLIPTKKADYEPLSKAGMYLSTFVFIGVLAILTVLFSKKKSLANPTKSLAFAGVSIALAFGLSYVKLFSLPQGGSVTLMSLLPVMIFSYVYGTKKGVFVCLKV
jgi:hypothetical protein